MNISVVGLGKLGAPLSAVLAAKGHTVKGIDQSVQTVRLVNQMKPPVQEPGLAELMQHFPIHATRSYEEGVENTDVTFVIVPTPSDVTGAFDNIYVLDAVTNIGKALKDKGLFHIVVISSTVMPGSCDGEIAAALEAASGLTVGQDIGLCYSPEFIALGSVIKDMLEPDMVLIGESDDRSGTALKCVYESVVGYETPIQRMNLINAEIAKISVNCYLTTKISIANTIAELCEKVPGGDAAAVTQAMGLDSRIGSKYLSPGLPASGPCLPRDQRAFSVAAAQLGVSPDIARAVDKVNARQVGRLVDYLKTKAETQEVGLRVGIVGMAYKPGTPVTDESPGVALARELTNAGFWVSVYDPMVTREDVPDLQVNWTRNAYSCFAGQDVGIVALPLDEVKKLIPDLFRTNPTLFVVDCWDCLDAGPFEETNVLHIGKGKW